MDEVRGLDKLGAELTALSNQFRQKLFEAQALIEIEKSRKRDSSYTEQQPITTSKRAKTGPKTVTEVWEFKPRHLESLNHQPWYIAVILHEIQQRLDTGVPIDEILLAGETALQRLGDDLEQLAEIVEKNLKASKSTFTFNLNSEI